MNCGIEKIKNRSLRDNFNVSLFLGDDKKLNKNLWQNQNLFPTLTIVKRRQMNGAEKKINKFSFLTPSFCGVERKVST